MVCILKQGYKMFYMLKEIIHMSKLLVTKQRNNNKKESCMQIILKSQNSNQCHAKLNNY